MSAHDSFELVAARPDYAAIAAWIPEGASVLDLGCGDGFEIMPYCGVGHVHANASSNATRSI